MKVYILDCEKCGRTLLDGYTDAEVERMADEHRSCGIAFVDTEGMFLTYRKKG